MLSLQVVTSCAETLNTYSIMQRWENAIAAVTPALRYVAWLRSFSSATVLVIGSLVPVISNLSNPARALIAATLLWGCFFYLPAAMSRDVPVTNSVDPFSAVALAVFLPNIPLATIPIFFVWFWFPRAAFEFEANMNPLSQPERFSPLEIHKR